MRQLGRSFINFLLGALCCQFALLAVVASGWTARSVRRKFFGYCGIECLEPEPRWLRRESESAAWAIKKNFALGFKLLLSTLAFTLPATAMWTIAWWGGWNNSFNKGYEDAAIGPLLGLFGLFWFAVVMLYVPLAQARQSVCDTWGSFFDFKTNVALLASRPWGFLILALQYAIIGLLVLILISLPIFFPQINPSLSNLSSDEALGFLEKYFFWVALIGFIGLYFLRIKASKAYAKSLLAAYRLGALCDKKLCEVERSTLRSAPVGQELQTTSRLQKWVRRAFLLVAVLLTFIVWVGVGSEVFVAEFFNYHPVRGFLNHPLIQLPWFSYMP